MPTRKDIEEFTSQLTTKTVLQRGANTYWQASSTPHDGERYIITRAGKTTISLSACGGGKTFHLDLPSRVGDVLAVDRDEITYRIGRGEHTATWRIVTESEGGVRP
jgi:hypothetical protein